jgi:hypothetical protein
LYFSYADQLLLLSEHGYSYLLNYINLIVNVAIGEENETHDDDSAFADPPHSPLGAVRAPLASEENILASLGPKEV